MPDKTFQRISVIGLGYIGLPTAAVLAARGIEVVGVEVNPHVIKTLNEGNVHIVEPELDVLVRSTVKEGLLRATSEPEEADAFIVAVPTPFKHGFKPDLGYIKSAASAIAPVLKKGALVVLESTSPVGATEKMADWLAEERPDLSFPQHGGVNSDIRVAHCPERVLPGRVLHELVENDRVIGGMTERCASVATSLYKIFVQGECIETDVRTAEMTKLTENAFRDVNIAFANELSTICDRFDVSVWELIKLANHHPRVNILQPGPGVGGHCIAVDPWFIVDSAPEEAKLIKTARQVNDGKPGFVLRKVKQAVGEVNSPRIACLGLAFKANIDDLRESPALSIVTTILEEYTDTVLVVEPHIDELPESLAKFQHVKMVTAQEAISQANIIVLLVDHDEFRQLDTSEITEKKLIDTRGIWQ